MLPQLWMALAALPPRPRQLARPRSYGGRRSDPPRRELCRFHICVKGGATRSIPLQCLSVTAVLYSLPRSSLTNNRGDLLGISRLKFGAASIDVLVIAIGPAANLFILPVVHYRIPMLVIGSILFFHVNCGSVIDDHSVRQLQQPPVQQCFPLTPLQHQLSATSQPTVFFSHTTPTTNHQPPTTNHQLQPSKQSDGKNRKA